MFARARGAKMGSMNGNENLEQIRKLRRSRDDRMVSGVCGGAAAHFGIDPSVLRLIVVGLSLFSAGTGALLYLACWIIIPED